MRAFDILLVLLGLATLFILVRWLLRRHVQAAHQISRSLAIFLWALGFIACGSIVVMVIQVVIIVHFPTVAQLISASDSELPTWILFGIVAVLGVSGLVMGCRGRLPGTK
jgi:uncharacterized membrane protein YqjE